MIFSHGLWRPAGAGSINIPTGGIVILQGAGAVPAGWTLHAASDDSYIIGAGADYNPADTGGSGDITLTVSDPGTHTVANNNFRRNPNAGAGPDADGAHTHDSNVITLEPPYTSNRLISLDSAAVTLPESCAFLRHVTATPAGMTQLDNNDLLFLSASEDASGGSLAPTVDLTSDGVHDHTGDAGGGTSGSSGSHWKGLEPSGHTHDTVTFAVSIDLYTYLLDAWYSAAGGVDINNFTNPIIMYNSVTPPAGWALCDGTLGTPDMQNYFLAVTDPASSPGSSGDGTVSDSVVSSADGIHDHDNDTKCGDCGSRSRRHAALSGTHTHTVSFDVAWLPTYYSLAFMMKI